MAKLSRHAERLIYIPFLMAAAIALVVIGSGSTFGQRCQRLYPNGSEAKIERCVENLAKGWSHDR